MKAMPVHCVQVSLSRKKKAEAINTTIKPELVKTGYAKDSFNPLPRTNRYPTNASPKHASPPTKTGFKNADTRPIIPPASGGVAESFKELDLIRIFAKALKNTAIQKMIMIWSCTLEIRVIFPNSRSNRKYKKNYQSGILFMFFYLSKILTIFLFPLPLCILVGLTLSFWLGKNFRQKGILSLPFWVLWLFSSFAFSQLLIVPLEDRYPYPDPQQIQKADAIVVLGGMVNNLTRIPDHVELNGSADRLTETLALYHQGYADKIIFSGGSGSLAFQKIPESEQARLFFGRMGIPSEAVLLEDKSRNTRENALFTGEIMKAQNIQSIILVTSAFHMQRSIREFSQLPVKIQPYPTDYRSIHSEAGLWEWIFPHTGALEIATIATKEWVGILVYGLTR